MTVLCLLDCFNDLLVAHRFSAIWKGTMNRIIAWVLFDFANSSYSAVISAVVFPVYYATVIVGNDQGLGDLWWGRAVSLSMLIVAGTSPFIGGIADISGRRKLFLALYTALCVASVSLFSVLGPGMIVTGFVLAVFANVGMEGGFVFYNSYLPVIAEKGKIGRVSAAGFAVGYLGSIISLLIALAFIKAEMISAVWFSVALFFSVFSLPLFLRMPPDSRRAGIIESGRQGVRQTIETVRHLFRRRDSRLFLIAYLLYEDGVNTVIVFSSIFAVTSLGFTRNEAIILFLVVQVSALIGALAISGPIDRWGSKSVVKGSLVVWTGVTLWAYLVSSKEGFYAVATTAGLVLGIVQAGSRALFASFVPKDREAEFFGVYSTVGKTTAVIGPLLFGIVSNLFHTQRPAVLSVAVLFLSGLFFLSRIKEKY